MTESNTFRKQVLASLVAAVLIVAVTIAVVTANLGRGLDPDEIEERQEQLEERREEREERRGESGG